MPLSKLFTTKRLIRVIVALLLLFGMLAVPWPTPDVPKGPGRNIFFPSLKSIFSTWQGKTMGPYQIQLGEEGYPRLRYEFKRLIFLADSLYNNLPLRDDSLLTKITGDFHILSSDTRVLHGYLNEMSTVSGQIRTIAKSTLLTEKLITDSMTNRPYYSIYGTRADWEEAVLRLRNISVPSLLISDSTPSATPYVDTFGVRVHSGDILISRGGAPTSALIARGSDYPGNFSHAALVHVDENTHQVSIIESHIEIGVAIADIDAYFKDKKLRVMVLRLRPDLPQLQQDPMLPHVAATNALRRAQREHIAYDFAMDYNTPDKLFCSEVVSSAYQPLGVNLWKITSTISSYGTRRWLGYFGVRHFETQEPSDLEYDPQVNVVAEWRDLNTLYQDHVDNAIVDVLLEGAEAGDELTYDWYLLPFARLLKGYCVLINFFGGVGPIPEGMNAPSALRHDSFRNAHAIVKKRLLFLAEKFQEERGYRPPYFQLIQLARQAKQDCNAELKKYLYIPEPATGIIY